MKKPNKDHIMYKYTGQGKPDPETVHNHAITSRKLHISPKIIIVIFVVAVVAISALSIHLLTDDSEETTTDVSGVSEEETSSAAEIVSDSEGSVLFAFTNSSEDELLLMMVASWNTSENSVSLQYIPVDMFIECENVNASIKDHFSQGGISRLTEIASDNFGHPCSRYILCDDDNLYDMCNDFFGDIEVNVKEDADYSFNGIDIKINAGPQTLKADMTAHYFSYLCENITGNEESLCELMKFFADFIFENEFLESYYDLVNYMDTNVSHSDISEYEGTMTALYNNGAFDSMTLEAIS